MLLIQIMGLKAQMVAVCILWLNTASPNLNRSHLSMPHGWPCWGKTISLQSLRRIIPSDPLGLDPSLHVSPSVCISNSYYNSTASNSAVPHATAYKDFTHSDLRYNYAIYPPNFVQSSCGINAGQVSAVLNNLRSSIQSTGLANTPNSLSVSLSYGSNTEPVGQVLGNETVYSVPGPVSMVREMPKSSVQPTKSVPSGGHNHEASQQLNSGNAESAYDCVQPSVTYRPQCAGRGGSKGRPPRLGRGRGRPRGLSRPPYNPQMKPQDTCSTGHSAVADQTAYSMTNVLRRRGSRRRSTKREVHLITSVWTRPLFMTF